MLININNNYCVNLINVDAGVLLINNVLFQEGIFILDIYANRTVANDRRLKIGDQILAVGSENFRQIELQKAKEIIMKQGRTNVRKILISLFYLKY